MSEVSWATLRVVVALDADTASGRSEVVAQTPDAVQPAVVAPAPPPMHAAINAHAASTCANRRPPFPPAPTHAGYACRGRSSTRVGWPNDEEPGAAAAGDGRAGACGRGAGGAAAGRDPRRQRRDGRRARGRRRARTRRSLHLAGGDVLRWDGDTIRVIGDWRADRGAMKAVGRIYAFGGDTITVRVVTPPHPRGSIRPRTCERSSASSAGRSSGTRRRSARRSSSRATSGASSPRRARSRRHLSAGSRAAARRLRGARRTVHHQRGGASRDGGARRGTVPLRRIATLVAGGKPQAEVVDEVTSDVGKLFGATSVMLVRWEGIQDEVVVIGGWSASDAPAIEPGAAYRPGHESATIRVLETGFASRSDDPPEEAGGCSTISAPVIVKAALLGALTASRPAEDPFPAGSEVRLRASPTSRRNRLRTSVPRRSFAHPARASSARPTRHVNG